jgi:pro-apoptotic serine protease NMA111
MVRKVDSGHNDGLQESDVILTLNGKLITRVPDLDIQYYNETLSAVVVRRRKQISISVPTVPTTDLETSRVLIFCGAVLHRPHHAVRQQISKIHSDVYISGRQRGSPAYMYNLAPTNFITHVNGVPTPDLDTFLREATKIADNTYFRLKVMTFDNVPWVATMKKNEHYFPTIEFLKDDKEALGWKKVVREAEKGGEDQLIEGGMEVEIGSAADLTADKPKARL